MGVPDFSPCVPDFLPILAITRLRYAPRSLVQSRRRYGRDCVRSPLRVPTFSGFTNAGTDIVEHIFIEQTSIKTSACLYCRPNRPP